MKTLRTARGQWWISLGAKRLYYNVHMAEQRHSILGYRTRSIWYGSHGPALNAALLTDVQAFHLGTERDSALAAQMAKSMQQDSSAMKTISVLGLVFLPGTLISVRIESPCDEHPLTICRRYSE